LSIHGLLLQVPRMKSWAGGRGETTGPGLRPKLNRGTDGQLGNPANGGGFGDGPTP
jgi:hypothetical protein